MGALLHLVHKGGAWVGCGPAQGLRILLTVPNVAAHPLTASVPMSYYSKWHYNYMCPLTLYCQIKSTEQRTIIHCVSKRVPLLFLQ